MEQHPTEDPDTIIYGAHEYRRVDTIARFRDDDARLRGIYKCGACEGQLDDWEIYCPWCGRKLQPPEKRSWEWW